MTEKDAIEIIELAKAETEWGYPLNYQIARYVAIEAFSTAIETLKKQVPKKPTEIEIDGIKAYKCECGEVIYRSEYFCAYCGQKIDWGDEND